MASSLFAQLMQPGGGVMLLPFVRIVIGFLLCLTVGGFIFDVARIHMAILSFLCSGLLFSLSMFENEYKRIQSGRSSSSSPSTTTAAPVSSKPEKSD